MDLYAIHPDPKSVPGYATRYDDVPALVWDKYQFHRLELKIREKVLAKEAKYAFKYAYDVLKERFPAGEAAIAKNGRFSYFYAYCVLKGPFLAGEAAIAEDDVYAFQYARWVLLLPQDDAEVWGK